MKIRNRLTEMSLMLVVLQLTACTPHSAEPQHLIMRNPASEWCVQQGGQQVKASPSTNSKLYCLLPSGERIEQWALFHRDHSQ